MHLFPTPHEDLLDGAALPKSARETELNYRTRPLSAENELRLTFIVLFGPVFGLIALASLLNLFLWTHPFFDRLTVSIIILLGLRLGFRKLIGVSLRHNAAGLLLLLSVYLCAKSWNALTGPTWCLIGVLVSGIVSCLISRQVAAWILVNPRVDSETMTRWRYNLPELFQVKLSLECPELIISALTPLMLPPLWILAAFLSHSYFDNFCYWPLCYFICLQIAWIALHSVTLVVVPWPNWLLSWRMTFQAMVVFITYDVHQTRAAGIFRFPSRWLRPIYVRWVLLVLVLLIAAFACQTACPNPFLVPQQGGSFIAQLGINWLLISIEAPALLLATLWFTSGALLARFHTELTKFDPKGPTDWDNYIDRMINSSDELEREHFFSGVSTFGDYPILLHQEIFNQHMHLLGDSGASKTSLGIAPTATQLIARASSTVVVVDLKGDKALFETCRIEAERAGNMGFRWISNEVGMPSFAFNPFQQTHNQKLSTEQFVQEILQGLSLDHGIAYGAGYFTAMNEIVLSTILRNFRVRSFRELDPYLSNRKIYSRIGNPNDWDQARHLGSLVSRLAKTEILNVIPGMYPDQPLVHSQAIDALNLFEKPQVIYLWLRSAAEPTNGPTIARLFLWAMFAAASQRPLGEQRVYFFMDEFQQVLSDGIRLIFEQFRDLGGTMIAAHQTIGQLRRSGIDLLDTIESCTAVKQVFRASDLNSLERLEKLSGTHLAKFANWVQPHEISTGNVIDRLDPVYSDEGMVRVREGEQPRLDRRSLLRISSNRLDSLVRFTFGSGYTQFAGATVPMTSFFPISLDEYERRRSLPWSTAPGTFVVPATPMNPKSEDAPKQSDQSKPASPSNDFIKEFDRRGKPAITSTPQKSGK